MKLDKQQTEQIEVLAKKYKLKPEEVTVQFEEILGSKKLAGRDEKDRPKSAMRMLLGRLNAKNDKAAFGGKTEDIIIRVEQKEEPTEFNRKDGKKGYRSSVYCVARSGNKDFFTVLTLWNDANEVNPEMVIGETYATKVVKNGNQLSMNNPETLTPTNEELSPMSEVITDSYPVIGLNDLEGNISDDWNDLKLIKGVISGAWSKETTNGNMMGFLKIISEDSDDMMVAKFSRIYEQVDMWDDGSLVYVLGQVTPTVYDESTGEIQYEASAWGNLVIPIDAFEKEVEMAEPEDEDEELENDEDWDIEDDDDWDE